MNRLTQLRLAHFRNFAELQKINLRPITLIYGANSSGKSSIVKALKWLRDIRSGKLAQTAQRHFANYDFGKEIELGFSFAFDSQANERLGSRASIGSLLSSVGSPLASVQVDFSVGNGHSIVTQTGFDLSENPVLDHIRSSFGNRLSALKIAVNDVPLAEFASKFSSPGHNMHCLAFLEIEHCLGLRSVNATHPLLSQIARASLHFLQEALEDELHRVKKSVSQADHASEIDLYLQQYESFLNQARSTSASSIVGSFVQSVEDGCEELKITENLGCDTPIRARRSAFWFTPSELTIRSQLTPTFQQLVDDTFVEAFSKAINDLLNPTEVNAKNDPFDSFDFLHIPSLRDNPDQPFFISSAKAAGSSPPKGWPRASAQDLREVNALLKQLAKTNREASFEIDFESVSELSDNGKRRPVGIRVNGVRDTRRGISLPFDQVGTGISQWIPVLLGILQREEALVVIEQPELHLHPALQSELGDILIAGSTARRGTDLSPNQLLIETHSEHLLLRLMRRIRETNNGSLPDQSLALRPSDIQVLFVEDRESGSVIHEMPLNENGELVRDWPGGFFEEGLRELLI